MPLAIILEASKIAGDLSKLLRDAGCSSIAVADTDQLADILRAVTPKLLLLNMEFSGDEQHGLSVLQSLRAHQRLADVAVIAYSPPPADEWTLRAQALGAAACLESDPGAMNRLRGEHGFVQRLRAEVIRLIGQREEQNNLLNERTPPADERRGSR